MVALRGKKAKASSASRKAAAAKGSKPTQAAAANANANASTTDDDDENVASGDASQPPAMTVEERVQRMLAFVTHASLATFTTLQDDETRVEAASGMADVVAQTGIAPFLDAMLVALCCNGKDKTAAPQHILSRLTSASRKRVCGVIFSADEIAYSCRDCQVDSTCVICKDCFMQGNHTGHDVYFQRTTAGSSCDCGDVHAWKREGFCARHPGAEDDQEGDRAAAKRSNLPKAIATTAPTVIEAVVEFLYQVYLGIDQGFEFAEAIEHFTRGIPPHVLTELTASTSSTFSTTASQPTAVSVSTAGSTESRRRPRQSSTAVVRRSIVPAPASVPSATVRAVTPPPAYLTDIFAVRLHNDDVHSLGEVINTLCTSLDCGKLQARTTVSEADRFGDSVLAKMSLLKCAGAVGSLVRESLNVSVAPVWWERQMERVPPVLEWLRTISMASDGLYDLVSEALRKNRTRRMGPPPAIADFVAKGVSSSAFWKHQRVRLHSTAQTLVTEITKGEDTDLNTWGTHLQLVFDRMYRFREGEAVSAVSSPEAENCDNRMVIEFVKSVSLHRAYARHQSVRDGCTALVKRFFGHGDASKPSDSVLGLMVRWDCALRKRVAHLGHALLREHMLNKTFRKSMLESYASSYGAMTQSYLKGLGTSPESIFDFAVQFLTVPQLVKDYTRAEVEKDPRKPQLAFELLAALDKVLKAAVKKSGKVGDTSNGTLNVDHPALSSQKYKHCIDDLEYVFNVGAMPNELVCDERNLNLWLSCLNVLQNGDLQVRRGIHQSHVEYESDSWLSMFNLGIRIHSIFPVSWNGMTPEVLADRKNAVRRIAGRVVNATIASSLILNQKAGKKVLMPIRLIPADTETMAGDLYEVYDFVVAASPTSFHVPLHRFLASSIRHVSIHATWLQEVLEADGPLAAFALDQLSLCDRLELIELPLRSLVMASQIQSNLWRRNGEENMMAQLYNYSALPYCVHYRDADVFLLQVGVLLVGPDTVLSIMIDRFQLGDFFIAKHGVLSTTQMGYTPQAEGVDDQQELQMVEEFLRLVIVLGTSLPSAVGEAYENLFMEEEMLQHLCAKPASFSKLFDIAMLPTGQDDVSVQRLEEVLSRVADFAPPSGLDPGRYELKDGQLEAYNPYFLHLNREAHEMARDRWTNHRKTQRQKHRAASSTPFDSPPLKRSRRPLQFLRKARSLLTCEGTLAMVHIILWKLLQDASSDSTPSSSSGVGNTISDAVISTTLHLLVYGIYAAEDAHEEEDAEEAAAFWRAMCAPVASMADASVLSLLWKLVNSGDAMSSFLDDEQTNTLEWLLRKIRACSVDCGVLLDQMDRKKRQDEVKQNAAVEGSAGDATSQPAATLEQRKDEARKRALDAMARQQAAFQAMMASMGGDDEDDEEIQAERVSSADRDEDDEIESTHGSGLLGKRRSTVEGADEEAEDLKRPRLADDAQGDDNSCYKCILCHDTSTQGEMGVAAYVHQSTVLTGSFRPEPEEGLEPRGAEVRKQIKSLIGKMDLCSGGPSVSSNSPSPALRALAAQFPDWYMDDGFDDELMLDAPLPNVNMGAQRQIRHNTAPATNNARDRGHRLPPPIEAFLMNQDDDDLEMLEGVLDLRDDQRLFPLPIHGATEMSPDRRNRGAQRTPDADRGIIVARRGGGPILGGRDSDFDDDDDDFDEDDHHDHRHHHRHHQHHHQNHNHNHSPRRPRAGSRVESVPLHLTPCGLHIRTCQHAVHIHCLERYIRSLHEKAIRGEDFDGVQAIDPDAAMTQFLCPLCKTLCNFLLPTSDPASGRAELMATAHDAEDLSVASPWHQVVDKQLQVPGWYRSVLGRDGDFGDDNSEAHELWRDYFEETLWEPHGSLEKGAPFLWSACAFSIASFLNVAEDEFQKVSPSIDFDPLTQDCPPSLEKEVSSLVAVTKFCRWSFSLLEHSEDAKVIWETSKRCCPINTETKREYRKFTKVLGSIDACLRGTILGLLVADTFTAFVVSSVIADSPATIWQFIPVFSAADLLQRVYTEFFVQSKSDERSLLHDKFSIVEETTEGNDGAEGASWSGEQVGLRRSTRSSSRATTDVAEDKPSKARRGGFNTGLPTAKSISAADTLQAIQESEFHVDSEEYAVLTLVKRILVAEPDEKLKPLTKRDVSARLQRIKSFNAQLVRRMKLFWRCLSDDSTVRGTNLSAVLKIPSLADVAAGPKPVFEQIWKWCVDRMTSKSFLGIAKNGDKCEHAEGCGEGYIASMFILRDQMRKPRLIDLPLQYDELYSMMSGRKCTRCEKTPCDPGICLVCGEFLCCGDSCCSHPYVNHGPQVGECTRHAAECGGGIGIVLMLDQCRVAIIGGSMAAHFPCPYVDAHGEEDVGLQRGRPLRLDMARYKYLESLWLNHRIFAEVSRQRNQREPQFTINLSYL